MPASQTAIFLITERTEPLVGAVACEWDGPEGVSGAGGRSTLALGAVGSFAEWAVPLAPAAPPGKRLRELAARIEGEVATPASASYAQARLSESTRFDSVHPAAIVFAVNPADVAATISWARRYGIHLVPRSGGHSYAGYSTTTGVVLDVGEMRSVRVALDRKTAVLGAGTRLIDVYADLWTKGVTIPAGSCATVGIAGLTLGGGVGYASRKLGLTCDNVTRVQIVTAAGEVLNCDATHHDDLFWACRGGGGGNFGVATNFDFAVHPVSTVSTYSIEWPWAEAGAAVQAWQKFAPHAPDELFSVCDLLATNPGRGARSHVVSAGQFFGSEADLRTLIQPLANTGMPLRVATKTRTYLDAMLFWAGCSGETVGQCHLSPRGTLARVDLRGQVGLREEAAFCHGDRDARARDRRAASECRARPRLDPPRRLWWRDQPRSEDGDRVRPP